MSTASTFRGDTRRTLACALLLSLSCLTGAPAAAAPPADSSAGAEASKDLRTVQGLWEREEPADSKASYRRATKDVRGNEETVTYYDARGDIVRRHKVDFDVSRMGEVKIFTYTRMEVTEGPQKGSKMPGPVSYIYWANDKYFREAWGFLPGQETPPALLYVWRKAGADRPGAGLAPAAEKPAAKPADAKGLEGTWRPVSSEQGGRPEPEAELNRHRMSFKGDKFTIERDGAMLMSGTYTIDASKSPVPIDMTIEEHADRPEQEGKVARGIIEQSGDTLKWCAAPPDAEERPTAFQTRDGTEQMLVVLKRE
jgi:uncharacterized protein (TIGR03067 family)